MRLQSRHLDRLGARRCAAVIVLALFGGVLAVGCTRNDDPAADNEAGTSAGESGPVASTPGDTTDDTTDDPTPTTDVATDDARAPLPGDEVQLPVDDAVRRGVLDNGLTYYLRSNDSPGARAEMRLVVGAGSANETAEQSGVAHFVEHMMFNGTEKYPANELIGVLESFGNEFGPDVNAFTSYTETVYQLSIATDNEAVIDEAFTVLSQWAGAATFDPTEVERERGVVAEEWRERGQGVSGRISTVYSELLTEGTAFEDRLPIGDIDAIQAMTDAPLRAFYADWYTPSNMAVVVVGDLDLDDAESLIEERFGELDEPDDTPARPDIDTVRAGSPDREIRYRSLADPDLPTAYIELIWPGRSLPARTVGDLRRGLALNLAAGMIDARFADDVTRGDGAFLRAYSSTTPLVRDIDTPGLLAEASAGDLGASFDSLLIEIERIRRDGFSDSELERAIAMEQSAAQQALAGAETIQDSDHAAAIVEHHLGAAPLLSAGDGHDIIIDLLDSMTKERIAAEFLAVVDGRAADVVVVGPLDDQSDLPDREFVLDAITGVASAEIEPRADAAAAVPSLMDRPDPRDIVEERTIDELDTTVIELANGVTVAIRQTGIEQNAFTLDGIGSGGRSALDDDTLTASFVAPDVVLASGVGDLDQVALDRFLADRVVQVSFGLDETTERVAARASTDDAEVLFALLNRYLTEPRVTEAALATVTGSLEPFAADPTSVPGLATAIAIGELRYGQDPRFAVLPPVTELSALDADAVLAAFAESFGDLDGWVFTIVGDLDPDVARDLAQRYLGTLPVDAEVDEWADRQPDAPSGISEATVNAGTDPQGSVSMLLTSDVAAGPETELALRVLQLVVSDRLRTQLREELGVTYSPEVAMIVRHEPDDLVEVVIEVSGDPSDLEPIVEGIRTTLGDLVDEGIGAAELATAAEPVRRDLELVTNPYWSSRIIDALRRPDVAVLTVGDTIEVIRRLTADALSQLADQVLGGGDVIIVRSGPE